MKVRQTTAAASADGRAAAGPAGVAGRRRWAPPEPGEARRGQAWRAYPVPAAVTRPRGGCPPRGGSMCEATSGVGTHRGWVPVGRVVQPCLDRTRSPVRRTGLPLVTFTKGRTSATSLNRNFGAPAKLQSAASRAARRGFGNVSFCSVERAAPKNAGRRSDLADLRLRLARARGWGRPAARRRPNARPRGEWVRLGAADASRSDPADDAWGLRRGARRAGRAGPTAGPAPSALLGGV